MNLQLITVPCKRGYEVKLGEVVGKYVRESFVGEKGLDKYGVDLERLRARALGKLGDKIEGSIEALSRYYDQLTATVDKIPIEENGVRIDFKWDDAFGKDSLFGKKSFLKMASGNYERICILFNIAALQSQVAETQNFSDDSRLQNAAKYFQQAAGIFSYLKSVTPNIIEGEPTSDLNIDTLSTLSVLMVAQAQELIYVKAARDQMKVANVAKIAQQAADLYANALQLMQVNSVKYIWPKDWIPLVAGKEASFHAIAEYYQAKSCGESHAYGEQIARLKKATELMKTSNNRAGSKNLFRLEQDRIKVDLENMEKENNVIYHDNIPTEASLSLIPKVVLAREIMPENPMNKDFKDLFSKIVPIALQSAMITYQNKHKSMVTLEVYRLKEASNILSGVLASLNMPAALEENKGDEVPLILLEKSASLRNEGGISKIDQLLKNIPNLMQQNNEILTEAINMLNSEEESDKKLREQFKDRWSRTPSNKLTESWYTEYNKFTQLLLQAKSSDDVILKSYDEFSPYIRILSQDESVIKANLPKSDSVENKSDISQNHKQEIKLVYNNIEIMKTSRELLLQELLKCEESNTGHVFMKALTQDPSLNVESVAEEQINATLLSQREQVQQSLDLQEKLLVELQEKCSRWNLSSNSTKGRSATISSMLLSVDKYHELLNNLQEGTKFYGDLTNILLKYQNKVKDFCFARQTEKEELLKELQSTTQNKPTSKTAAFTNFQPTSYGCNVDNQIPPIQQFPPYQIPSPYNFPQPYNPAIPHYGYQPPTNMYSYQRPLGPGSQLPLRPSSQVPQYPSGYNYPNYPGYNSYHPR